MSITSELEQLTRLCKKIAQAYRIRLKCLQRRHLLLRSIGNTFDNVSKNPNFYSSLRSTLSYEKMVLRAVGGDMAGVVSRIESAMSSFERSWSQIKAMHKSDWFSDWISKNNLSPNDLRKFLDAVIKFLFRMKDDLNDIFSRIELEEKFLNKGEGRNVETFGPFLAAWENEMKANRRLLGRFNTVITRNSRVFRSGPMERLGTQVMGGSIGVGLASPVVGLMMIGMSAPSAKLSDVAPSPLELGIWGAVITSGVMVGFILNLFDGYSALTDFSKDEELLRKLRKEGIRPKRFRFF